MPIKKIFLLSLIILSDEFSFAQKTFKEPKPSTTPNAYQLAQIKRKYGMFIHFGINTFIMKNGQTGANLQLPITHSQLMLTNG
jgi:hypothetical protein